MVLTLVMTWPVGRGLLRDVPGDLGDPLLNCWILVWDADHLLGFLRSGPNALTGFWNANIFFPEPLTLAYSEHLVAQAVQMIPIYALTRNPILCYNLLFLSTFVLSGLGVYLLVRDITGRGAAAFVAGLIFAFAPYRLAQLPHLQVLSSQWMPFVLLGLRRYLATGHRKPLIWGSVALVAQNLSCGYYMLFFAPFVALYTLFELHRTERWRDRIVWRDLGIAGLAVILVAWPFTAPYLELRHLGFRPRPIEEVTSFSADVYSYLTANPSSRLYGRHLRAMPKPEGELFPGVTPILFAVLALGASGMEIWRRTPGTPRRGWTTVACIIFALVLAHIVLLIAMLMTGGFVVRLGPFAVGVNNVSRVVRRIAVGLGGLALISPRARLVLRRASRSTLVFFSLAVILAFWLSLGPAPMSRGFRMVGAAAYSYLYDFVPGFDGLRVPARLAMLVALFLALAAGYGAAILDRHGRTGRFLLLAAALAFLIEATGAPVPVNQTFSYPNLETLPSRVYPASRAPAVYKSLRTLPAGSVVVEFPFGTDGYEIRYMFYSTLHWRPLVNGYSGGFPDSYLRNRTALRRVRREPDFAWSTLATSGATHAVVHEWAYPPRRRHDVSRWLEAHGARRIASFRSDHVFELPRVPLARSGH